MTDDLARRLGLTDSDIADLDRLAELMTDGPQPPDGGPEDDECQPSRRFDESKTAQVGSTLILIAFVLAGLAWFLAASGATTPGPERNDVPAPCSAAQSPCSAH